MSEEIVDNFIEEIVKQKINIEFEYSHYENNKDTRDKLVSDLRNLVEKYNSFKDQFPEEHSKFVEKNPKYDLPQYKFFDVLEIFAKDTEQGFKDILSKITPDTTQTVINVIEYAQTNKCFQWLKRNNTQAIKETASTQQEKGMFLELGALSLPKIKREEFGDLIGFSMSGGLSENFEKIKESAHRGVAVVRGLLAKNRKYLTLDYSNYQIKDETAIYSHHNQIYHPRGLMAQRLLDSSYSNDTNLFVTICTNNDDVGPQGAHLLKAIYTLNKAYNNNELVMNGKNLIPSITFFNQGFFCTQDEKEATTSISNGPKGGSKEVEGFHHLSKRSDFEKLLDTKMSKLEMDKINGLTMLSMLGNDFPYPEVPVSFKISDIIYANPVTAGCSTMWLYKEFLHLQALDDPKRTRKLFNFLLDYSQEVTESLLKISPQLKVDENNKVISDITATHSKMIEGILRNFTSYNLQREMSDEEKQKIKTLSDTIKLYNEKNPATQIKRGITKNLKSTMNGGFEEDGEDQKSTLINYENLVALNKEKVAKENQAQTEVMNTIKAEKEKNIATSLSALVIEDREKFNLLKERLTNIGLYLYDHGSKGVKVNLGDYLEEVRGTSLLVAKTGLSFSTVSQYLSINNDYNNEKKLSPKYFFEQDFLKDFVIKAGTQNKVFAVNSQSNKSFIKRVSSLKDNEEKQKLLEVKTLVDQFFEKFRTENSMKDLLAQGGINKQLEDLVTNIEKDYKISSVKKPKKN